MAKDYSEQKRNLKRRLRELNQFDREARKKRAELEEKLTKYQKRLERARQGIDSILKKEWAANDKWFELDEKLQKILANEKRNKKG